MVYEELRHLARCRFAREPSGITLQPTALVHEAYLKLVRMNGTRKRWNSRAHFFAAAAEAMRRILVDEARRRRSQRRGGDRTKLVFEIVSVEYDGRSLQLDILDLDEALTVLENESHRTATVVKLLFFSGFSVDETAALMQLSPRTVGREWRYARAWLKKGLQSGETNTDGGRKKNAT